MAIPKHPRYQRLMDILYEFNRQEEISFYPVDPFKIVKKNKWGLISYSELANDLGVTVEEVEAALQSKDGYVTKDKNNYTIAYNDTIKVESRIRFTIMHEIGHIVLGHLDDFDETILRRSLLTEEQYSVLEKEANAFSRNFLAPAPLVIEMKREWGDVYSTDIQKTFNISRAAAQIRLSMLDWDFNHSGQFSENIFKRCSFFINTFLHRKQCQKCGHASAVKGTKYCSICGNEGLIRNSKESNIVKYNVINLNDENVAVTCPKCKNEDVKGPYCHICGTYLVNRCTGWREGSVGVYQSNSLWHIDDVGCGELLPGSARYCHKCSSTSTFYELGLLDYWEHELMEEEHNRIQLNPPKEYRSLEEYQEYLKEYNGIKQEG